MWGAADADFPAVELVAAGLATAFGVPLPTYAVIKVPDLLIDVLLATGDADHVEFGESFRRRGGMVFGSRYLGGVPVKWDARLRRTVEDADRLLVRLLVFDAFIENSDRTSASNPNLLVSNGQMYAIDHGQSLPSVQGITGKSLPYTFDSHLGWTTAQEQPHLLDQPIEDLRRLSDAAIDAAIHAVPGTWWTAADRAAGVQVALRKRRDQLPGTLVHLAERLR